ncbi:MAG TPA: restriction endonuclease subunit S [Candidatus Obscuribacterales bacterium]
MIELTFKQTQSELMVRAAATIIFNTLLRYDFPIVPLSSLTEHPQYGFTASASQEILGVKLVRITDLQDGKISWDTVPYCQCEQPEKYLLKPNDILFARTGATTGKTHLVKEAPAAVFASYLIRVRPKGDGCSDYLYYFFQSDVYWRQIIEEKEGSAQPNVNGQKLMNIGVPIVDNKIQLAISQFLEIVRARQDGSVKELPELPPPLDKQRRIVARIEELATKVEEVRGLRRQSVEEAEDIWESSLINIFSTATKKYPNKTFEQVCEVVRGGSPRPAGSPTYYDGSIPFLKVGDLTKDDIKYLNSYTATIKEAGLSNTRYVQANTLMLTNSGATLGVPKICTFETTFNDGIQAFIDFTEDILKEYLYYFLRSKTQWFREWAARGQGQPNLNTNMVKKMLFPLPPLPEQHRIVAYLDDFQAKVDTLKRLQAETAAELDALMPSILDKAFKGEL